MHRFPTELAVDLERWLAEQGDVFTVIRGHDSGCTSYGFARGTRRWFVKAAYGTDTDQLESALRFHAAVRHPRIVPLAHSFPVHLGAEQGLAVVYPWVSGEILNDPFAPGSLPHRHPRSALNRLRSQPLPDVLAVCDEVVRAHEAVVARGFVAVDLYDGCLIYDFERCVVHLVDLDLYRRGPYVLATDRQFGSTRFMAPEELRRGATVDERTTLFTVARAARVLLGEGAGWRAGPGLAAVVDRGTAEVPTDRHPTYAAFAQAWHAAR